MGPLRIRSGHKDRGYVSSTAAAVLAFLGLVQPGIVRAAPQELVSSGVSSVVRDTPNYVDSTLLWTTAPTCSNAAGDELQPALINRAGLYVYRPRTIFSVNPPRPVGTCNPYRLLSDVVTDSTYLYFIDNQGPAGHSALWRRDRLANAADPSELLADLGDVIVSAELLFFDHYVFAILHRATTFDVIVEYDKTGVLLNGFVELAGADDLTNMQFDGRYLYWMNAGALRRNDTTNGAKVTSVNGPISTYYLEGYDQQCNPKVCEEYSRVLFAQGNQLFEIDTVGGGGAQPQYTSVSPNARITAISRDAIHYFFIERRPVGGGFDREDRFYRLGVGSSEPALIYGPVNNGGPGFDAFVNDGTWLYFRDRSAQKLLRLANDAAAIPIYDVSATYMEVTQGLQNYDNALRLIEGKRTIVRVFAHSTVSGQDVKGVTASLQGDNQQGYLGRLDPVNAEGKLITVRNAQQRTDLTHSFQFELPRNWTTGGNLSLTATINPFGRVVEDITNNNTSTLGPIVFSPSRRLHVGYLNFRYVLNGTSYSVPIEEYLASQRRMRHLYPLADPVGAFGGVGLRITFGNIWDFDLGPQVARTAQDCIDRYEKPEDRNMCASDRVHGQIAEMRRTGAIHEEVASYGNIPQAPSADGRYFTRGYANGRIGSGPSTDPNYAPHEIGHVLGRGHPTQGSAKCGHSASDDNYPYFLSVVDDDPNRQTRYAGLDFDDTLPGGITFIEAGSTYDTMSYCSPNWISDYTYNGIYDFLLNDPFGGAQGDAAQGAQVPIAGDWLIVTGTLDSRVRRGGFTTVRRTTSVMDATAPVAGGFTLELRGGAGGLLASHGFTAMPIGEQPDRVAFDVVVPFIPGTTQLRVVEDATARTLATRAVSANAPLVSDVQLVDAPDPVDGPLVVTWNASDADGDPLRFDVLASRDGGATYRPIQLGIEGDSIELDTSLLGGGATRLRVVASDGVQTAYAESAPFNVTPRAPVPMISSPVDGFHADWGQLIAFEAEIQDLQDESIADADIVWENDYRVLGTGRMLQTDTLEVGTNRVTVTATNSLGASGSASITVVIGDPLTPLGPTLSVAPQTIAWHVANDETPAQVAQLEVENAGDASLDFDVTSDAPWLRIDSALEVLGASAPRTFIISADPTLVPAGTTSNATLTFVSHANANDVVTVSVALSRGNVFDHTGPEAPAVCAGDCDESGVVTVDELVRGVNIALDRAAVSLCTALDTDADGRVTVNEVVGAVNAALHGC